jgi:hypothetical protein
MLTFIQCITKILESSKSYTRKIYVGSIGAYSCQTSIIVLQQISSLNTLYKSQCIPAVLGFLPLSLIFFLGSSQLDICPDDALML